MKENRACKTKVCVAALGAAFAASPLAAAEVAHRWSFNGDWADSAGGADATGVGDRVSLYGGRVHIGGYAASDAGYVILGTNMLDTAEATMEIWARHDGVRNWSRVFDYGTDTMHYFQMPWTYGTTLGSDSVGAKNGGAETSVANTMAPYELGTDYHIAVTFQRSGEATVVRWQRRDAATGELQKSGTLTMPAGIHGFVDPVLYLGHSQYAADRDALAAYDEVRLWSGVLSDAQLAASAAAGPDAAISATGGTPRFTAPESAEPPARRAAVPNGGFRLMTYNIQYCYDRVKTIIPDRTAARIIAENPDFCCLNEVRDNEAHPEATLLAKLTDMHKSHFGADSQGNLLLSREVPDRTEQYALPYVNYSRHLGICEFSNIVVAVTHLDVSGTAKEKRIESIAQIKELFSAYASAGKPVFLCGDWNCGPATEEIAAMNEFMTILSPTNGVRTYHAHSVTGGGVIDYIAVDTAHAEDLYVGQSFVVDDIDTSDHNPVIAEIYLRPAASTLGWIDESFLTTGRTGTWSPAVAWDAGSWTAELAGENVFTPGSASGGNVATVDVTAAFDAVPQETATPGGSAQCALWLGTNGNFQVWTTDGWVDVAADGVTPRTGTEYSIRFTIDYRSGRHSVAILDGGTYKTLAATGSAAVAAGTTSFPIAAPGAEKISRIRFDGEGLLRSIAGRYAELEISGFSEDEIVSVNGGVVRLTGGQAEWLNAFGDKTAVADAFAGLSGDEFAKAYLLNLDVMDKNALDDCVFEIAGISVGDEYIEIGIRLIRPRAIKEGGVAKAINGTLRIYGASTLEGLLDPALDAREVKLMPDDFGDGKTEATATIEKTGREVFFNAAIE